MKINNAVPEPLLAEEDEMERGIKILSSALMLLLCWLSVCGIAAPSRSPRAITQPKMVKTFLVIYHLGSTYLIEPTSRDDRALTQALNDFLTAHLKIEGSPAAVVQGSNSGGTTGFWVFYLIKDAP